jgi:hypothetical protein
MAYGSHVRRHGKSRALWENQSSKFLTMAEILRWRGVTPAITEKKHPNARPDAFWLYETRLNRELLL